MKKHEQKSTVSQTAPIPAKRATAGFSGRFIRGPTCLSPLLTATDGVVRHRRRGVKNGSTTAFGEGGLLGEENKKWCGSLVSKKGM